MLSMRSMAWWPGLTNLWYRGEIYSLAIALLFASLLNIALLATLIWPEWAAIVFSAWSSPNWFATWFIRSLWGLLAFAAMWTFAASFFSTSTIRASLPSVECDNLLAVAQSDYLRGQYFEAEATLHRILSTGQEDVEAALLLASILRRTGRFRQALDCLERLERLDRSQLWISEIAAERRRCAVSPATLSE